MKVKSSTPTEITAVEYQRMLVAAQTKLNVTLLPSTEVYRDDKHRLDVYDENDVLTGTIIPKGERFKTPEELEEAIKVVFK
jgi:hypothetical protein